MNTITHPQLVTALAKPPLAILNSLSLTSIDSWHAATGISGECGELLEMLSAEYDHDNLIEELGDIEFYMEQLRQRVQIDRAGHSEEVAFDFTFSGPTATILREQAISMAIFGAQVLDLVKKMAIYNNLLDVNPLMDAMFRLDVCMAVIRRVANVEREEVLAANIAKLSKRYADLQYSDGAAQQRADKPHERNFIGKSAAAA